MGSDDRGERAYTRIFELAPHLAAQLDSLILATEMRAENAQSEADRDRLCVLARHARATKLLQHMVEESSGRVPARAFIDHICEWVQYAHRYPAHLGLFTRVDDTMLVPQLAHVLGFAANELVSNAYAHAFPDARKGTVEVSFEHRDGQCQLLVEDDGVGLPGARLPAPQGTGLGIVEKLALSVGGTLILGPGPGTRLALLFPCR